MGITVKEIQARFTNLKHTDIEKLLGTPNYKATTVIPLNRFAKYDKSEVLSYVANREGTAFTQLLNPVKRAEIAPTAKKETSTVAHTNTQQSLFSQGLMPNMHIPMNQSVFTLQNNNRA